MSVLIPSESFNEVLKGLAGRGRGFERLTAWFLLNDPEWSARVARVWLWEDWPGRWGPDRGIDLVAETHDSQLIAVQAKHYDPGYTVSKSDVDSFLSESNRPVFAERLLVATTLRLAGGARQVIAAQEKPVSLVLRDRLEQADVDWTAFAATTQQEQLERARPKPHQALAVEEAVNGLADAPRGQLIMPCGTGKTLTSLWVAERLEARTVLVLVPTLVLVRQLAQVWRAQSETPFALLKVCSDTTADDEIASADLPAIEVGGHVTTDPQQIADFIAGEGRRVLIGTYDSSPRVAQAMQVLGSEHRLDLVICDEAHHCAGLQAGAHKTVLDDEKIPVLRRLFVTATPTVFAAQARAQAAHAHARVASMDDRQLFGRVLHRLTFKRAVEQGLLCPYQVVVMPVRDDEVSELVRRRTLVTPDHGEHVTDAYTLAAQIACLRAMRRFDCNRLVAFHAGVPESKRFTAEVHLAADLLDPDDRPEHFHAAHVDGYMTRPKREQALRRFLIDADIPQMLSNVRLLAEGLDVPGIDAICLMNTQHSPAWIAQAVGRVVRTAPGKELGTVVLPVLVREGQALHEALRSSEHKPVLDVLAAMRSIDADIVHTIETVRLELGSRRRPADTPGQWRIDAPTEIGEEFAEAVEIELIDLIKARTTRRSSSTSQKRASNSDALVFDPATLRGGELDFSDPETIEAGLRVAQAFLDEYYSAAAIDREYQGFPIGQWWDRVQRLWQDGLLPEEAKPRIARLFNWMTVDGAKFPRAREEMIELDDTPLADRLDDWLSWGRHDRDGDLSELVRARVVGWRAPILTSEILELAPSQLPVEERVEIALAAIKITGQAMWDANSEQDAAIQGFLEALDEPGRPHGLETQHDAAGRPVGRLACYGHGWDAAQAVLRLARDAYQAPARRKSRIVSGDPTRGRRPKPRRRAN